MFDLDVLYKRYIIYKIKKSILPLLAVAGIVGISLMIYESASKQQPLQQEQKILKHTIAKPQKQTFEEKKQSTKLPDVKKEKMIEPVKDGYYKFFTLAVKEKNKALIKNAQKKYKSYGLDCKIEDQNNYLNLVCGETSSYEEYKKIRTILKEHNIKYYLIVKKKFSDKKKDISSFKSETFKSEQLEQNVIPSKDKKEKISIQKPRSNITHTRVDIDILEKKFSHNNNYAIAIRIAKEYYLQKNYEKSLYWAKKANNLDRKKTQSWIIYAKSLYALGEKKKALKVLMLYKRFASSSEVDRILQEWKKNDK